MESSANNSAVLYCPYCGHKVNLIAKGGTHEETMFFVRCDACKMSGPQMEDEDEAVAAWNSLRKQPGWTKKPTGSGRYWYRSKGPFRPTLWWIYREPDVGLVVGLDDGEYRTLEEFCRYDDEAEWCGPIEAPD